MDQAHIDTVRSTQVKILDYIDSAHPTFLGNFKIKVTSGNFDSVQAAIQDGADKYFDALNAIIPLNEDSSEAYATEFLGNYGESEGLSLAQIASNVQDFESTVSTRIESDEIIPFIWKIRTVWLYYYFWVYIAAAFAIVVILVLVLGKENPFPNNPALAHSSSFLRDDYVSLVTANFSCANP